MRSACGCSIAARRASLRPAMAKRLLARGRAAFDELRQGIRDIEFIADPHAGELRIGCPEFDRGGISRAGPRALLARPSARQAFMSCRCASRRWNFPSCTSARSIWCLARLANEPVRGRLSEELNAEVLFNDRYALVVGEKSKWARRRKVDLADLVDEPWIMSPLDALGESFVANGALRAARIDRSRALLITTFSIHLRNNLVSDGEFHHRICRPRCCGSTASVHSLTELPIELAVRPPVAVVTLEKSNALRRRRSRSSNAPATSRRHSPAGRSIGRACLPCGIDEVSPVHGRESDNEASRRSDRSRHHGQRHGECADRGRLPGGRHRRARAGARRASSAPAGGRSRRAPRSPTRPR